MLTEYQIKEKLLNEYGTKVTYMEFYRDVFPIGSFENSGEYEQGKANGILCSIKDKKGQNQLIFDDLEEIKNHVDDDFVLLSPIAYFGKRRSAYNASLLYGMVFDLDDVGEEQLSWILERLDNPHFPRATYIVNSGFGLHLYYLFQKPIPLYKSIHKRLNALKHEITRLIWNKYTSRIHVENRQYQGVFQGFRMVGSCCKDKIHRVTAYRTGEKVNIEYLNQFVSEEYSIKSLDYESSLTLEQAKKKYPEWYEKRIVNGEKRNGRWIIKRDLYDWWINKIKNDPDLRVGHRYFCIAALASYAVKCGICEDELRKDAYELKDFMNNLQDDFSDDDIENALNFYHESFITFPRAEIEKISGLNIPINKRNGRKQALHLKLARANRDILQAENGVDNWYDNSPHSGRKPKKDIIVEWRVSNPNGKKIDCHRDTGLDPKTIRKWWNK